MVNNYNLSANLYIIRAVYRYMAMNIEQMPHAMERFYKYLSLDEDKYHKLVEEGYSNIKEATSKLVSCGFSDTLFRRDHATFIKCSEALNDVTYKRIVDKTISHSEYTDYIEAEIGSIRNTDNTLLVVSIRRLIDDIYRNSTPDETMIDFANLINDIEYSGHILQKNIEKDIIDFYKSYLDNNSDNTK